VPTVPVIATGPMLVVSTHFDDAVLSLGGLVAAAAGEGRAVVVVTACGGCPPEQVEASEWDRACGFRSGAQAAAVRAAEDRDACAILGAAAVHLDALDGPYRSDDGLRALAAFVTEQGARYADVYLPAAIGGNQDHAAVRDVALRTFGVHGGQRVWLYADLPYASTVDRWAGFAAGGNPSVDEAWEPDLSVARPWCSFTAGTVHEVAGERWDLKRAAVCAHASQLAVLGAQYGPFLASPGPLQTEAVWPVDSGGRRGG
jgi:LmbE family N-acetylglucosaminyl deacetylase